MIGIDLSKKVTTEAIDTNNIGPLLMFRVAIEAGF